MDARITQMSNGDASGLVARPEDMSNSAWEFYGNTDYEGNFTADIDAIASEAEYPSVASNTRASSISHDLNIPERGGEYGTKASPGSIYADTTASLEVQYGSIYDLAEPRSPVSHDCHVRPSRFESEEIGPSPLDTWMSTREWHQFSYRGVQPPSKKRKAAKGRSDASTKKSSRR